MSVRLLAALQGMGEYGALTGGSASGTATFGRVASQAGMWVSDHRLAVIAGAVILLAFIWWVTSSR